MGIQGKTEWPATIVDKPAGVVYNVKLDGSFSAIDTLTYLSEKDLRPLGSSSPREFQAEFRQRLLEWKQANDALLLVLDEYAPTSGLASHTVMVAQERELADVQRAIGAVDVALKHLGEAFRRQLQE